MAIVALGHLIGGISGNLGSTNFANAQGTVIARSRPTIANQRSEKQLLRRSRYMLFKSQWHSLTDLQQRAWRTQATQVFFVNRLGMKRHVSGWQYWMTAALSLRLGLDIMPTIPPNVVRRPPLLDFSADFTQGGPMNISTSNPAAPHPILLRLYLSRIMSNKTPAHFPAWTYCGWLTTGFPTQDWEVRIEQFVGTLLAGEVVGLRMHLQLDGALLSTGLIRSTTVA